jgi:hypothetical protein
VTLRVAHDLRSITRKGGKVVTIPLAPRTARAAGLAIGERCEGPTFLAADGRRLDRHGAGRIVRRVARRAGDHQTRRPAHLSQVRTAEQSFCGTGGLGSDRRCEPGVLGRHPH